VPYCESEPVIAFWLSAFSVCSSSFESLRVAIFSVTLLMLRVADS
jgi:hypothetical protein